MLKKGYLLFSVSICLSMFSFGCQPQDTELTANSEPRTPKIETQNQNLDAKAANIRAEPAEADTPVPEPSRIKPIEPNLPKPQEPEPAAPNTPESDFDVTFHGKCADILNQYVNDQGRVDYKALKRKRFQLGKLLDEFAELKPQEYNHWPDEDKAAFWINAYNIQMLNIIVRNYPIVSSRLMRLFWHPNSIRHIKGIRDRYKFIVMDEEFTLKEIEQCFFVEKFKDPRIFLALSQASLSGPALQRKPYYGKNLSRQLDEQVKKFLAREDAFRIDRGENIIYLSAMFQPTWYGKYFISKYGIDRKFKDKQPETRAVLNFLTGYISGHDKTYLEVENYTVKYITYDWRLNE